MSACVAADVVTPAPCHRGADERNHHLRPRLTLRALTGDGFGVTEGDRNEPGWPEEWRAQWVEHINRALD